MTDERKVLYRELLYWAMSDIKAHSYVEGFIFYFRYGRSNRRRLRFAYAITQWLHNLAMYSAGDFKGFQEDCFWRDYADFRQEFPADRWAPFTEEIIKELRKQQ